MKKIVFHYPHLKFWAGGTKFLLIVADLIAAKNKVSFIINVADQKIINKFTKNKIKFLEINKFLSTNSIFYWLFFPFVFIHDTVKTILLVNRKDILLSCIFPSNAICALAAKVKGAKHYHYCFEPFPFLRNPDFIKSHPPFKRSLLSFLSWAYSWLDDYGVKNTNKVFTLNEITQRQIKKTYGLESIITLMGVDTKHFQPQKSTKFKSYEPYVVHSTDYTYAKNTDLAIKTMAKLDKTSSLKLLITSTRPTAPEKNALVSLVKQLRLEDRVFFLDLVSYEDLALLYSNALCYLSCSYDEMMGTTSSNLPVKEALACGTPAIRANITTEDVEYGVSGYLVDPRKTSIVAKKIEFLHSHPQIAKQMGLAGRKKIVKLYQWEKVAKKILDNLKETPND